MEALSAEFAQAGHLPFPVVAVRMLLAAILGAAIGFEREWRNRPAGLRTHVLICIAAATFGILAIEIAHAAVFQARSVSEEVRVDPLRVIEAVTAGVAFLAAGTIILARGEVHGLTTGAGMWLAGSVGLSCGLGFWEIALFGAFLTVCVLAVLYSIERKFGLNDDSALVAEADSKSAEKKKPS